MVIFPHSTDNIIVFSQILITALVVISPVPYHTQMDGSFRFLRLISQKPIRFQLQVSTGPTHPAT